MVEIDRLFQSLIVFFFVPLCLCVFVFKTQNQ